MKSAEPETIVAYPKQDGVFIMFWFVANSIIVISEIGAGL